MRFRSLWRADTWVNRVLSMAEGNDPTQHRRHRWGHPSMECGVDGNVDVDTRRMSIVDGDYAATGRRAASHTLGRLDPFRNAGCDRRSPSRRRNTFLSGAGYVASHLHGGRKRACLVDPKNAVAHLGRARYRSCQDGSEMLQSVCREVCDHHSSFSELKKARWYDWIANRLSPAMPSKR